MIATIYYNNIDKLHYCGEGTYVLTIKNMDIEVINSHFCSDRTWAEYDLVKTEPAKKILEEYNITQVYSNGRLVYNKESVGSLDFAANPYNGLTYGQIVEFAGRQNKVKLIKAKFNSLCEKYNTPWWNIFDSERFEEVEDYAKSLDLNACEKAAYDEWIQIMTEDL